jgi:hypothetical protein
MPKIVQLILWLAYPFCGLLGWYFYVKYKHEERRLMIEKGLNPKEDVQSHQNIKSFWLKLGIVILGFGLGFFIISLLIDLHVIGQSDAIYPAILCLCGGGALVFASYISLRKK